MKNPRICPNCKGTGKVPRKDLPPLMRGAIGVRQHDECPICNGLGYVEGS